MIKSCCSFECTEYVFNDIYVYVRELSVNAPTVGHELFSSKISVLLRDEIPCNDIIRRYLMTEFNFDFAKDDGRRVVVN